MQTITLSVQLCSIVWRPIVYMNSHVGRRCTELWMWTTAHVLLYTSTSTRHLRIHVHYWPPSYRKYNLERIVNKLRMDPWLNITEATEWKYCRDQYVRVYLYGKCCIESVTNVSIHVKVKMHSFHYVASVMHRCRTTLHQLRKETHSKEESYSGK